MVKDNRDLVGIINDNLQHVYILHYLYHLEELLLY
jgi:hypothetical protein